MYSLENKYQDRQQKCSKIGDITGSVITLCENDKNIKAEARERETT